MSVAADHDDEDEMLRQAAERAKERAKHLQLVPAEPATRPLQEIMKGIKTAKGAGDLHQNLQAFIAHLDAQPSEPVFTMRQPIEKWCKDCRQPIDDADPFYGRCEGCHKIERRNRYIGELLAIWEEIIPKRHRWAKYDSEAFSQRIRVAPADLERLKRWDGDVLIQGASGTGKTSLAVAKLRGFFSAAKQAIDTLDKKTFERGKRVFFANALQVGKSVREHRLGEGRPFLIERCLRASVLVLDELGTDFECYGKLGTAGVVEVLWNRFADEKPTIVCSYLERADVVDYYGDGIARRLGESLFVKLGTP